MNEGGRERKCFGLQSKQGQMELTSDIIDQHSLLCMASIVQSKLDNPNTCIVRLGLSNCKLVLINNIGLHAFIRFIERFGLLNIQIIERRL